MRENPWVFCSAAHRLYNERNRSAKGREVVTEPKVEKPSLLARLRKGAGKIFRREKRPDRYANEWDVL